MDTMESVGSNSTVIDYLDLFARKKPDLHGQTPIFMISYSGDDTKVLKHLRVHLDPALKSFNRRTGGLQYSAWDYARYREGTTVGGHFPTEVAEKMWQAHAAIVLISPAYVNSPFCIDFELPFLLWRMKVHGMQLFLVRIGETVLDDIPQPVPAYGPIAQNVKINLLEIVDDRNPSLIQRYDPTEQAMLGRLFERSPAEAEDRLAGYVKAICRWLETHPIPSESSPHEEAKDHQEASFLAANTEKKGGSHENKTLEAENDVTKVEFEKRDTQNNSNLNSNHEKCNFIKHGENICLENYIINNDIIHHNNNYTVNNIISFLRKFIFGIGFLYRNGLTKDGIIFLIVLSILLIFIVILNSSSPATYQAAPVDQTPPQTHTDALGPKLFDRLPTDSKESTSVAPSSHAVQLEPATPNTGADTAPSGTAAIVVKKAILYEEPIPGTPGTKLEGQVLWSFVNTPPLPGDKPMPVIRAVITIPDVKLDLTLTIRKNDDGTLPASHIVEFKYALPTSFPGGGIDTTLGMIAKQTEEARGDPLIGAIAPVASNLYWLALSSVVGNEAHNLELLKGREWFDVPIRYSNHRRAILTFEKGVAGAKAFEDAFANWGQ